MPEIGNSSLLNQSYFSDHFESDIHARQCLMVESNKLTIALIEKENVSAYEQFSFEEWNEEVFLQSKIASLRQSLPALALFRTDAAILIPEEFRKNRNESLRLFFSLIDGFEIAEHKPAAFPAGVYFPIRNNQLASVRNQFPGAVIMHHSLPVFLWMMNHKKMMESSFLMEISNGRLYVYAVNERKPLLYNSFEVNSPEDTAYYALFVMEQLGMDPVKQSVYFMASAGSESLLSVCRNFIPALLSAEMLSPLHKREQELLFPFVTYAALCE